MSHICIRKNNMYSQHKQWGLFKKGPFEAKDKVQIISLLSSFVGGANGTSARFEALSQMKRWQNWACALLPLLWWFHICAICIVLSLRTKNDKKELKIFVLHNATEVIFAPRELIKIVMQRLTHNLIYSICRPRFLEIIKKCTKKWSRVTIYAPTYRVDWKKIARKITKDATECGVCSEMSFLSGVFSPLGL